MVNKKKICAGCGVPQYIYKCEVRDRYCKLCWDRKVYETQKAKPNNIVSKPIPTRTPIKKVSDKRKLMDIAYSALRRSYLDTHPFCAATIKGVCTLKSDDIHHLYWGKDREKHMNDFTNVISICRGCHTYIHSVMGKAEAIQMGFKKQDNENGN